MTLIWLAPHFAPALLLPALALLLALLGKREKRQVIPTLMPWRAVLALPRPKPRRTPIDFEFAAALGGALFVALALMGPVLLTSPQPADTFTLVVDTSLSMGATAPDGSPRTRAARARIRELSQAHPDADWTLVVPDRTAPLVTKGRLSDVLDALERTPGSVQDPLQQAAAVQAALAASEPEGGAVIWIGDRPVEAASPRLVSLIVGTPVANLGLVEARRLDDGHLFVTLFNAGAEPARTTVQVNGGTASPPVEGPPGETLGLRLAPPGGADVAEIRLAHDSDGLPVDDAARVDLRQPVAAVESDRFPRVALALRAAAGLKLTEPGRDASADLIVTQDGSDLPPTGDLLLVRPEGAVCGILKSSPPAPADDARVTPRADGLPEMSVTGMGAFTARDVVLPEDATVLADVRVSDARVPLIALWNWNNRRVGFVNNFPETWTTHPGFPVLIRLLAQRIHPPAEAVPGLIESDTRMPTPATGALPPMPPTPEGARRIPLSTIAALLAAACAGVLAWREWTRLGRTRPARR